MAIDKINATALLDGGVTTADIADDAITNAKLAANSVTSTEIASGSVTYDEIATGTITTSNIADGNITTAKLDSTLDLSGKTVNFGLVNGDMPSRSILKVWETSQNTYISNSVQNSYDAIFPDVTVTTTGTNSRLVYMCFLHGVAFANSTARLSLKVGYNGVSSEVARDAGYTLTDTRFMQSIGWTSPQITSAGTSVTANMYYAPVSNGDAVYINKPYTGSGLSTLFIFEVKDL